MKKTWLLEIFLVMIMLSVTPYSYAGSDRWIMTMTIERMNKENLVFVRFFGPDGAALESDDLMQIVIRKEDCSTGHTFQITKDYRMGFAPKNMLLGIYLSPFVWNNKSLCFSVPGVGKVEQRLNPAVDHSRSFQLKMTN
jgi:hypothetical protein